MVFVQKWPSFNIFFWGNIGKKNVFYDILAQKKEILCYKNKKFKKSIIEIFPKGLTHGFGQNMAIFQPFLWDNIGQENVFYDSLERGNVFLRYKNKNFKKSKNWHFFKEVNPWFWSKNGHFSTFNFEAIYARKMSFTIF